MFGSVARLFDRDFVIAHLAPAALLVVASIGMLIGFHVAGPTRSMSQSDVVYGIGVIVVSSSFIAMLLFVANQYIYAFLSGKGKFNPCSVALSRSVRHYKEARKEVSINEEAMRRSRSRGELIPYHLRHQLAHSRQVLATSFPDSEFLVLPTKLGNLLRSLELYPRLEYGIEDNVRSWYRLVAILPKKCRYLVANTKSVTDFWANCCILSVLAILMYISLLIDVRRTMIPWVIPIMLVAPWFALQGATRAAIEWSGTVRAAFDVFLPALAASLEATGAGARGQSFSRAAEREVEELSEDLLQPNPQSQTVDGSDPYTVVMERYRRAKADRRQESMGRRTIEQTQHSAKS